MFRRLVTDDQTNKQMHKQTSKMSLCLQPVETGIGTITWNVCDGKKSYEDNDTWLRIDTKKWFRILFHQKPNQHAQSNTTKDCKKHLTYV